MPLGTKRSGLKSPARRGVVLEQEVRDLAVLEEALGHRFVAAFGQIAAAEIAPAHVDADQHVRRRARNAVVDGLDVEIDQLCRDPGRRLATLSRMAGSHSMATATSSSCT